MGNILRDQMFYRSKQLSVSINQKRKDQFLHKWYIGINTSTKRNELKKNYLKNLESAIFVIMANTGTNFVIY